LGLVTVAVLIPDDMKLKTTPVPGALALTREVYEVCLGDSGIIQVPHPADLDLFRVLQNPTDFCDLISAILLVQEVPLHHFYHGVLVIENMDQEPICSARLGIPFVIDRLLTFQHNSVRRHLQFSSIPVLMNHSKA
jgi:hypothetical protein